MPPGAIALIVGAVILALATVVIVMRFSNKRWMIYIPTFVLIALTAVLALLIMMPTEPGSMLDLAFAALAALSFAASVLTLVGTFLIDFFRRRRAANK